MGDALRKTRETLHSAQLGLSDLVGTYDGKRQLHGIMSVITFGRAVTNVLQGLRHIDPGFDTWYAPHEAKMRADPLLKYFYDLRSELVKQGPPVIPYSATSAVSFTSTGFTGGWSTTLTYYLDRPLLETTQPALVLPDPPNMHLGERLTDLSAQNLCRLYVNYLTGLVEEAERHFPTPPERPARRSALR